MLGVDFAQYVTSVRFRRAPLGYRRDDVHRHLSAVRGWFLLAGLDDLLNERLRERQEETDRQLSEAKDEAARIVADARREADEIIRAARANAEAIAKQAQRQGARGRRGWSRIGRPAGGARLRSP